MRRVRRKSLEDPVQRDLDQRQQEANRKHAAGALHATEEWKAARRAATVRAVHATLRSMMGDRERCMYCLDSHGSDIEHFWPKTPYPERMFQWLNLLLCCTECGRFKGDEFPLSNGLPLLVDPTVEEPWEHLDFDTDTGNVVAKFDAQTGAWSPKGEKTVEVLQLDRREALSAGYQQTFHRLSRMVENFLAEGSADMTQLVQSLRGADDHGLLGWCVTGNGRNVLPFRNLWERHPEVRQACADAVNTA